MPLDANALVDLITAKTFLVIPGTADDAMIELLINRASDLCEAWCHRSFKERALSNMRLVGPGASRLPLRAVPIQTSAAVTVTVDGIAQTVWRTEADGDPADFDVMVASFDPEAGRGPDHLYRSLGWGPTRQLNPYNVLLSYTGGFAAIPADVQQAGLYVVQKLFRDHKRQLAEVAQVSGPFGSVSVLDNALPRMARLLLGPYVFPAVA